MNDSNYTPPDITLVGDAHVKAYLESNGAVGHMWNGVPCLVLTTTGAKSGEPRQSALIYGRDGDRYLIIASQAGAPTHPNWYHNLRANPQVTINVGDQQIDVTASTAEGDEHDRLWKVMTDVWPNYDTYQTRTERVIPVVVLTPS
ncbi:MAG TPA: nitroreductase family deazaflavin-dependent oxidoreductase [Ilumatobacteraceae bacterium]|nr:nitroreductase family deazaflavin-dependent oxidoreductase [Ilumatobacteraceae bacterium]